jgi:Acyltransferase
MRSRSSCLPRHVTALWLCSACQLVLLLTLLAGAFVLRREIRATAAEGMIRQRVALTPADDSSIVAPSPPSRSYFLSREEIKPIFQLGSGDKEKLVNAFGLWSLVVTLLTCPLWAAAMSLLNVVYKVYGDAWDPHRALYDTTGKIWSKSWLTLSNSMPTFSGHVDQLQEGNGPCLYVANHASWLDIPILCTVLDPVFKFIAKGELRGVPCIGQQLVGVRHTDNRGVPKAERALSAEGFLTLLIPPPIAGSAHSH